jgi:hypothetical protein
VTGGTHELEVRPYDALLDLIRPAAGAAGILVTARMPLRNATVIHDSVSWEWLFLVVRG